MKQIKKKKKEKKYKQEINESAKINKRRLVKVTPALRAGVGGGGYIQNCVVSQFTALEC